MHDTRELLQHDQRPKEEDGKLMFVCDKHDMAIILLQVSSWSSFNITVFTSFTKRSV